MGRHTLVDDNEISVDCALTRFYVTVLRPNGSILDFDVKFQNRRLRVDVEWPDGSHDEDGVRIAMKTFSV